MDSPGDHHQHADLQRIKADTMSNTEALLCLIALMLGIVISMSVPTWAVEILGALGVK